MSRVIDAVIKLTDQFTKPAGAALKSMTSMSKAAVRVGKDIQKTGKQISDVGSSLTGAVTIPVAGVAAAAGKMALDFENSVAKVSTIADTSKVSLDDIRKQALEMSNSTGVAVTDILNSQYDAISAGASTADSLRLVEIAAKAAKGGFTDTGTALDGLTSVYNSFQGAVDYQTIADQFMVAQNFGKTTFDELASSMGQVTPIANSLNISTDELLSSVAVLTKNGIATSQSVTGLKAAYSNILKPTEDAKGAAKALGLEFNAAHLKSVGWVGFLEEIKEKTGGDTDAMAKLFGSVEALNAVTVLAGSGFSDVSTAMEMMENASGMTETAFQKMLTPTERCAIAVNKLKNTAIQAGERFVPVFEKIVGVVDKAANRLANLSDEQIDTAIKIAGMAAAAGPAVTVFGKLVTGVGTAVRSFNTLGLGVKKAGGLLKFLISPSSLVVAGILAVIAVVYICVKNFDRLKAGIQKFLPYFESARAGFARIYEQIQPLIPIIQKVGSVIWDVLQVVVVGAVAGAVGAFAGFLNGVVMIVEGVIGAVAGVVGAFRGFLTGVTVIIEGIIDVISGIITFVAGVFTGDWEKAWLGIQTILEGIGHVIEGIVVGIINGIAGAINGVIGVINGITIPDWVPGLGGKSINIPLIPQLAKGTENWPGGIAQIHERGGEIIDLPGGSRVYPHDRSVTMAREAGRYEGAASSVKTFTGILDGASRAIHGVAKTVSGVTVPHGESRPDRDIHPTDRPVIVVWNPGKHEGAPNHPSSPAPTVTIAKLADQITVREEGDIKKLAETVAGEIYKRLKDSSSNMGGEHLADMA